MRQQLEHRLQQLKSEFESGQKVLAELEAKQANIQSTLLRIQGAIQVLEEELAKSTEEESFVSPDGLDTAAVNVANGATSQKAGVIN